MEIRQFRVVIRAKHYDRTCRFYAEALALPRLQSWEHEDARGTLFQAGSAVLEVRGRAAAASGEGPLKWDEVYDYQGPEQKLVLVLVVPSAEKAYEEIFFREKNIPGGLRKDVDGTLIFETHDPDGLKVVCREG
ncbi:MAG TPA: VOC family protein [Thermoanaerobaculia bacterium]|nr:VOC family protein [Thermoanaerobaculia bacterium]